MAQEIISRLEILDVSTKSRTLVYEAPYHLEAPNWTNDGQWLIFNSSGRIFKIPVIGGTPLPIDTGFAVRCNNDHVLSPDNKEIAVSHHDECNISKIYILPFEGGVPRLVTANGPSYLHGWSPDGARLAYCAERGGQYDIYTTSVNGGDEMQLTNCIGPDDGPEYSSDGKYIYFNSERTGRMQIWRMLVDGSNQEQLTYSNAHDWFPHCSPDRKQVVFLSYGIDVVGHPANKFVKLQCMPYDGGSIETVAELFGGQGTINVASWSPDSKRVAFVSYEVSIR